MSLPRKKKQRILSTLYPWVLILTIVLLTILGLNGLIWLRGDEPGYWIKASLIDVLQAGGTFGLGVISVYLTQRHYEERLKKETQEEIISPLYFEILDIIDRFEFNNFTDPRYFSYEPHDAWGEMKKTVDEIRAKKVDSRIPIFYESLNLHQNKYTDIYGYFLEHINQVFEKEILHKINPEYFVKKENEPFRFEYMTGYKGRNVFWPIKFLIFGVNPIDFIVKKDELFSKKGCTIRFWLRDTSQFDFRYLDVEYGLIEADFGKFILEVENLFKENIVVDQLRKEREVLGKQAKEISEYLESLID